MRILIADDNDDARELLQWLLHKYAPEAEVVAVEDGTAALRAVRSAPPDLAILDYQMPGLTGVEVAKQCRLQHVPAHVISNRTPLSANAASVVESKRLDYLEQVIPRWLRDLEAPEASNPSPRRRGRILRFASAVVLLLLAPWWMSVHD